MTDNDATAEEAMTPDALLKRLEDRCESAEFDCSVFRGPDGEFERVRIEMPAGRRKRNVVLSKPADLESMLEISFERYVHLGDLLAVCCYEDNYIEAKLSGHVLFGPSWIEEKGDDGKVVRRNVREREGEIVLRSPDGSTIVRIGDESLPFWLLSKQPPHSGRSRRGTTITITGAAVSNQEEAIRTLRTISNGVFFQIDLVYNRAFALDRVRRMPRRSRLGRHFGTDPSIAYPRRQYDPEAMSLYWYARRARGMPLLQFLAFYQCIEYYYPVYSQAEARKNVQNILKDPTFSPDLDVHVGRVVNALKGSFIPGYGDERSKLKATITQTIDDTDLWEYLTELEERREFFARKIKGLTDIALPLRGERTDVRGEVSARLYDIRCRIVHTKIGGRTGSVEMLLPFSKEAEMLDADIELVELIARRVLIAASAPLQD